MQQVSVAGLLDLNGRLLVVRRSLKETFLPRVWELPGGKLNFGESPDAAIQRELLEETGLTASIVKLTRVRSYMSKAGTQHNIELFYILSPVDEEPIVVLSEAHDEYRWIERKQLIELGLPEADPIRVIIASYFDSGA